MPDMPVMPVMPRPLLTNGLFAVLLTTCLLALGGCSNEKAPRATTPDPRADGAMIFYRLDGDRYPGDPVPPGTTLLHGYSVIKACGIADRESREEILNAFEAGIADHQGGIPVDCFRPRHAIRIVQDGVTTDHLICFECSNWMSWTNDEQSGGGDTSDAPRRTFDRILDECTSSN